ncbi:RNA polymerase sigma factor [Tuwongella immobilis]|uniref:RNA polymerase sigma-70 region 2 domain-containing protein n=1 Tax=Tuwongella immobilis TaxID=692036 RepID=A0A6C2YS78_9BACT|nr:RNA polymerase sigma factor [Tuwongella immobilis]VIP04528.1 rna polymerase sigma factor sigw : RNA polymerase, sigma-24 subunit, ECF subfamily OS=Pirellula staleyi (strain ATCC 27377 / DSM 6068 / ICPB 4128) GN=Psta_0563 PE=4 SV=1: Sigma70_r2: Sigma70_r4_2 [Tuwongella immobilis]VTS06417.1 rna polymerase sigma factor sigw : RNA polymerase, sigma-24 subunit, ECF subfamily OS=Pirellula staleyi (strain ATCC 27377 / DSM 6068 / ICPB 4128) GN=Psta_0563 PE=4 SV=1: Sigma70_r2: Sigma70_r4_2 [Tuwongella 
MSWMEIELLVEQAKLGDRAAYNELVRRFQASVTAAALTKLHDPLAAQELCQDVFVHAWTKLPQLRDSRCFAGWLRRITARMALNRLTRRGIVRGTESEILEQVQGRNEEPLTAMMRNESRRQVQSALKQLKRIDREALEAHYLRGQSLETIAGVLEIPLGTIKRRLHVARKRLKDVLEGNTDAGTGGTSATATAVATKPKAKVGGKKRRQRELLSV